MITINKNRSIFILLCCISSICFQSCDKDDEQYSIRGSWKLIQLTGSGETYAVSHLDPFQDSTLTNTYSYTGAEYNVLLNFDLHTDEHNESGTYKEIKTIDSMGIISTQETIYHLNDDRNWSLEGDTLFFDSNFYPEIIEIIELNKSVLSTKQNIDFYLIGARVHFIGTEYRTYKRME